MINLEKLEPTKAAPTIYDALSMLSNNRRRLIDLNIKAVSVLDKLMLDSINMDGDESKDELKQEHPKSLPELFQEENEKQDALIAEISTRLHEIGLMIGSKE